MIGLPPGDARSGPDDDGTAALLRSALQREADAVRPSPDGYARIRAELDSHPIRTRTARGAGGLRHGRRLAPLLAAAALVVVASAALAVRPWNRDAAGDVALRAGARSTPPAATAGPLPVYLPARQNGRIVLFREFRRQTVRADPAARVEAALQLALTSVRHRGDAVRLFAAGPAPAVHASVSADLVTVDLTPAPRPASATAGRREAVAALQQLVWTATAAAVTTADGPGVPARGRSVRLTLGGRAGAPLFGALPVGDPVDRTLGTDPLAPVWVIDPADGVTRAPGSLTAQGDAVVPAADATPAVAGAPAGTASPPSVHVLLFRDETVVREADVPLQPAAGGTLLPGQRGTWRITGWDVRARGTYTLEATLGTTADEAEHWSDAATFTVR